LENPAYTGPRVIFCSAYYLPKLEMCDYSGFITVIINYHINKTLRPEN